MRSTLMFVMYTFFYFDMWYLFSLRQGVDKALSSVSLCHSSVVFLLQFFFSLLHCC